MKRFFFRVPVVIVFLIFTLNLSGQISHGGEPLSWSNNEIEPVEHINVAAENNLEKSIKDQNTNTPLSFAYVLNVDLNNNKDGSNQVLPDGTKVWRLHLKSENAYSLNFTFSQFYIPDGAEVFVYSPDQSQLKGAFTNENRKESGRLPIAPIQGDELIVEYIEPANSDFEGYLEIETIGHDYINIYDLKDGRYGESGDCNIDINCKEGEDWQIEKRAVARMIINNSLLCTGVLVNNALQDATPYLLTANHCIENNYDAENTIFFFNYESPSCDGPKGDESQSISGAKLIAEKGKDEVGYLDFSLLELSVRVPRAYDPYFAGWDATSTTPENTICIHHPWADVKKISVDYDQPVVANYDDYGYDKQTFWLVEEWDAGVTEKGSSGSPLFNQNHKIVGTLSGGEASCGNPVNDLYQMFSASFDRYSDDSLQLSRWLDPLGYGITQLEGFEPYGDDLVHHAGYLYHYNPEEQAAAFRTPEGGYMSGNNEYGDLAKAEFFELSQFENKKNVTGGFVYFFKATGNDETDVEFFLAEEQNGVPGNIIASTTLKLGKLKIDVANQAPTFFDFYNPVQIKNSVFVGVKLPQIEGDTIAILNSFEKPDKNTAWEQNSSGVWLPYSDDSSWGNNYINYIGVESGWLVAQPLHHEFESDIKIFPNPANAILNIETLENTNLFNLNVYNSTGQLVYSENLAANNLQMQIDVSNWNEGLYIFQFSSGSGVKTSRVMVNH